MRVPHHHAHHLNLGVGVPTVLASLRDNYSASSEATPEAAEEDLTLNSRQGKQAEAEADNAERFPERIDNDQAVDEVLAAASPADQDDESIERQEVREGKQLLILPPTPAPTTAALCVCHCLCIRLCLCICVPNSFLNSYYHKLSENVCLGVWSK